MARRRFPPIRFPYTELSILGQNLKQLIKKLAGAVRETMRADWVAFIRVTFDENKDYTVEVIKPGFASTFGGAIPLTLAW